MEVNPFWVNYWYAIIMMISSLAVWEKTLCLSLWVCKAFFFILLSDGPFPQLWWVSASVCEDQYSARYLRGASADLFQIVPSATIICLPRISFLSPQYRKSAIYNLDFSFLSCSPKTLSMWLVGEIIDLAFSVSYSLGILVLCCLNILSGLFGFRWGNKPDPCSSRVAESSSIFWNFKIP